MPRLPRIHIDDAVYYIQMDGPSGDSIYKDAEDYQKYLAFLTQTKTESDFKLFAYALLPNRLHLLIETTGDCPISQIMQKITPNYTKYYNNKYERKGHLFPKRFRSVYVERSVYLSKLTRFIHLLPQKEGLASDFRNYAYSSYGAYAGAAAAVPMQAEAAEIIASLHCAHTEDPYERFMLSADNHELAFLEKKLSRGFFLGSQGFVRKVREAANAQTADKLSVPELIISKEAPVREPVAVRGGWGLRPALLSSALLATIAFSAFSVTLNHYYAGQPVQDASIPTVLQSEPESKMIARATPLTFKEPIEGMIWEVEIYTLTKDGKPQPIKDQIRFNGKSFESYYFSSQGFTPSNYTVKARKNGAISWETMQKNNKGEVISWRGDLENGRMEGVVNYQGEGKNTQNYQFMSGRKNTAGMVQHG